MFVSQLLVLAGVGLSTAHFILQWPPNAGFDDDLEPTYPCGSFTPVVNSSSPMVQVDQFAIHIYSTHPAAEWAFLGTTDTSAPYNFTEIVPVINTTGIGGFCLTDMKVPGEWAGKPGIIQVVDNSVDGVLYQCAPVNFVSGMNSTMGPTCMNATGFTAKWTTLEGFKGTTGSVTTSMAMMPSSSAASAASAAPSSAGAAAAIATGAGSVLSGLGMLAVGLVL